MCAHWSCRGRPWNISLGSAALEGLIGVNLESTHRCSPVELARAVTADGATLTSATYRRANRSRGQSRALVMSRGNRPLNESLDGDDIKLLIGSGERHRPTRLARATSSSNAVDVILGLLGKVVVHDEPNIFNVDAAGRDVGRHEHLIPVLLETLEGLLALAERPVSVDLDGGYAEVPEAEGDILGSVLGAGEDDDGKGSVLFGEKAREQRELGMSVDDDDLLLDIGGRGSLNGGLDAQGQLHVLHGEGRDLGGHGGREQKGLANLGDAPHDVAYLRGKADIEHMVSLVENDDGHIVEAGIALLDVVEQSPRGGDHDGRIKLEEAHLFGDGLAADEDNRADAQGRADAVYGLLDLNGKLASRQDDEAAGISIGEQSLDHGDAEGQGLAGSRLGDADDVLALHAERNHLVLNGRRDGELVAMEDVQYARAYAESIERERRGAGRLRVFISHVCT